MSDFGFDSLIAFSGLISDLSLLPRNNSLSGHWFVAANLFHCADQSHNPGYCYRSSDRDYVLPGDKARLRSPSEDCADHIAFVVLRVNHGRHRLPYALPNLSVLSQNGSEATD